LISRFASFQAGEKVRLKRSDAAGDEDEALRQLLRLRRDKRKHDTSAIAKADAIMPMNPAPARAVLNLANYNPNLSHTSPSQTN
jgi:hypothetical protein